MLFVNLQKLNVDTVILVCIRSPSTPSSLTILVYVWSGTVLDRPIQRAITTHLEIRQKGEAYPHPLRALPREREPLMALRTVVLVLLG